MYTEVQDMNFRNLATTEDVDVEELEGELLQGTVTCKYRGQYRVQVAGLAEPVLCEISPRLRKRLLYPLADPASLGHYSVQKVERIREVDPVAIGDRVEFVLRSEERGYIKEVLPRTSKLSRRDPGPIPLEQVLIANLDQMVPVVAAARPTPSWNLLDRYLVIAEIANVPALVCITKLDLLKASKVGKLEAELATYRKLGYRVLLTSSVEGRGIEELRAALGGKLSVLLGKSGVGKSTLLNTLQPGLGLRVQAVGQGSIGKGRHTTTHLEMFPLESGGGVVDTPGMRELGFWHMEMDLAYYFRELRPHLGKCKFGASCWHDSEPGCAIKAAVDSGEVARRRYESYLKMADELYAE